jgi:hypothetical protein
MPRARAGPGIGYLAMLTKARALASAAEQGRPGPVCRSG